MQVAIPQKIKKTMEKKTMRGSRKTLRLRKQFGLHFAGSPAFFFAAAIGCIMQPSCCHGLTVSVVVAMLMLQFIVNAERLVAL